MIKKHSTTRNINKSHIAYGGIDNNTLANSITTINIPEINNNSFLKGINYGGIQTSINLYNDSEDIRNLINVDFTIRKNVSIMMDDLGKLININFEEVETVTDIKGITISINFIQYSNLDFLGLACPP